MFRFGLFRILFLCGFFLIVSGVQAFAQSSDVFGLSPDPSLYSFDTKEPDIATIPALTNVVQGGAKLYYMGTRSSIPGWLIVKNGQIQMIYLSPDHKTVVIGAMFTSDGKNVTSLQLKALFDTNKELKNLFTASAQQQREILAAGSQGGVASVPGDKSTSSQEVGQIPVFPLSPGESLIQDFKAAAGVVVGDKFDAELIMMVAPGCPNCKATWKELRQAVFDKKIQVRLVPVYNSAGGVERNVAGRLLRSPKPLEDWDAYVNGDTSVLAGSADPLALGAIDSNLLLVSKWNIQGYPYLVYRGHDGRVKIVQGKPDRIAAVLADLAK